MGFRLDAEGLELNLYRYSFFRLDLILGPYRKLYSGRNSSMVLPNKATGGLELGKTYKNKWRRGGGGDNTIFPAVLHITMYKVLII